MVTDTPTQHHNDTMSLIQASVTCLLFQPLTRYVRVNLIDTAMHPPFLATIMRTSVLFSTPVTIILDLSHLLRCPAAVLMIIKNAGGLWKSISPIHVEWSDRYGHFVLHSAIRNAYTKCIQRPISLEQPHQTFPFSIINQLTLCHLHPCC